MNEQDLFCLKGRAHVVRSIKYTEVQNSNKDKSSCIISPKSIQQFLLPLVHTDDAWFARRKTIEKS